MDQLQLRVLVVDDNVDTAQTLVTILEMEGHMAAAVHNGLEVLEAARRLAPDAILLDVGLPGLNGYKVATLLREAKLLDKTLLVGITGGGTEVHELAAGEAGFDIQLVKPFKAEALLALLAARGGVQ
jgi:DNA-binding response OmpR family regulator